jgi:hypothetical protein
MIIGLMSSARQVISMNRVSIFAAMSLLGLAACGDDPGTSDKSGSTETVEIAVTTPEVSFKPGSDNLSTVKPDGPVAIAYRIIGNPIVGQPVAIELEFASTVGPQPMTVSFRVNDSTALQFPESQVQSVAMAPFDDGERGAQQVTIIPLREGRLYLNVSAHIETENGSMSSVTAVPIQVGGALREVQSNGEPGVDANGDAVISLPAKED